MDQPRGRVISLRSAADGDAVAVVDVDDLPACARCKAGKGCGAGLFSGRDSYRVEARVPAGIDVVEGDAVLIEMAGHDLFPAAIIVYGWPLAGAAFGALIAAAGPWEGDAAAVTGAILGLILAGAMAHRRLRSGACVERFRPIVVERAGSGA